MSKKGSIATRPQSKFKYKTGKRKRPVGIHDETGFLSEAKTAAKNDALTPYFHDPVHHIYSLHRLRHAAARLQTTQRHQLGETESAPEPFPPLLHARPRNRHLGREEFKVETGVQCGWALAAVVLNELCDCKKYPALNAFVALFALADLVRVFDRRRKNLAVELHKLGIGNQPPALSAREVLREQSGNEGEYTECEPNQKELGRSCPDRKVEPAFSDEIAVAQSDQPQCNAEKTFEQVANIFFAPCVHGLEEMIKPGVV